MAHRGFEERGARVISKHSGLRCSHMDLSRCWGRRGCFGDRMSLYTKLELQAEISVPTWLAGPPLCVAVFTRRESRSVCLRCEAADSTCSQSFCSERGLPFLLLSSRVIRALVCRRRDRLKGACLGLMSRLVAAEKMIVLKFYWHLGGGGPERV